MFWRVQRKRLQRRTFSTRIAVVVVALVFWCASSGMQVFAQQPQEHQPAPGDVLLEASRVYIFVDKTGFGHQHGIEGRLKASQLRLGATKEAGKLVFDMTSFDADTNSARKYVGLEGETDEDTRLAVNANMKGEDVLDVARYPEASFQIQSAKAVGKASSRGLPIYEMTGDFTLHGVKQPVRIFAEVEQFRGWLHLRGSFLVKQTDYGITPYKKAFGAVGVADQLKIFGDLYVAPTADVDLSTIPARTQ